MDPILSHPRPLLRRNDWWTLDGTWDFAFPPERTCHPDDVDWTHTILVPFAPETEASGIGCTGYIPRCAYRRTINSPARHEDQLLMLHFGAVDHRCTVWIDDQLVGSNEGGYSSFTIDVTRALERAGEHVLIVLVEDDPRDLAKPRGKQDWELEPHLIWYPRTTGIWQTVWMERVNRTHIQQLHWRTVLERLEVAAEIRFASVVEEPLQLRIALRCQDRQLVDDIIGVRVGAERLERAFRLDASGLDHVRESLLWTPEHPVIVEARLELTRAGGREVLDAVRSYTAIRTVGVRSGRFLLNGRPYPMRLVLDQGYWPQSGLTPPDNQALRRDVSLVKEMGFNGVRKHQKIEDPRYLECADHLGLMVWVEMPPAYQFDSTAVRRVTDEWMRAIDRDRSHPCIVAWVPFNESTGLLDLASRQDEQNWVRALTALTRVADPTRPVISNDGWETLDGDMIAIHDYEQRPDVLATRWNGPLEEILVGYAEHRRLQTLDEDPTRWVAGRPKRPLVLTEFGGIGWAPHAPVEREENMPPEVSHDRVGQPAAWGYSTVESVEELRERFCALMEAVHSIPRLAGFCYTQFADTYQEINGLLRADRTPKLPVDVIATATRGRPTSFMDPFIGLVE